MKCCVAFAIALMTFNFGRTVRADDDPPPPLQNPNGYWNFSYLKETNPDGSYKKMYTWVQGHPDVTGLARAPAEEHLQKIWDAFRQRLAKSHKFKNLKLTDKDLGFAFRAIDNAHSTKYFSLSSADASAETRWKRKGGKLTAKIVVDQGYLDTVDMNDPNLIQLLVHEGLHAAMASAGDAATGKDEDKEIYPFNNDNLYPHAAPVTLGPDGLPVNKKSSTTQPAGN